jgi:hypothetical protein
MSVPEATSSTTANSFIVESKDALISANFLLLRKLMILQNHFQSNIEMIHEHCV